jgi:hypothetical protein
VDVTCPAHPDRLGAVVHGVLRRPAAANAQEDFEVKNLKKAAALTMVAGSLVAAGAGVASATTGAHADGTAVGSPGVASGNVVQVPVHVPVNVVGNTVNVIGALNPAFGNYGYNG